MPTMTRILSIAAAGTVVIGLGAMAYFSFAPRGGDIFADCRRGNVAGGAATIGGPFSLIDGTGKRVTEADVITKPTLVYFGYTFCPDFCPTDLARNSLAVDQLAEKGVDVGQVFITTDPERDTPEVVRDFTAAIHPDMIGLTGTPEEIKAAAAAYRVYFRKAGEDPKFYMMDHSTFTYLMTPEHGFLEFYGSEVTPEDLAASVGCFTSKL